MKHGLNKQDPSSPGIEHRFMIVLFTVLALIVVMLLTSINTGIVSLTPVEVLKTLLGQGTDRQELVLFQFRLPRIVIAMLVGAGLAVSGGVLQGITRNPLAEPAILGINAGAGLMVTLFVAFFPVASGMPIYALPLLALTGGGVTAAIIFGLSYSRSEGLLTTRMLLVGIGVAAAISAVMLLLTLGMHPDKYQFVVSWLAGSIWGTNWTFVLALLPWLLILLPYVYSKSQTLNILSLGEQMATGLGASVTREQIMLLAAAVGLAASSVSVSGGIGFVGLVAPHLARQLVGPRHQLQLPVAACIGALLVLTADMLARWILQPTELATGVVVAIIGAPYFLYLLAKTRV